MTMVEVGDMEVENFEVRGYDQMEVEVSDFLSADHIDLVSIEIDAVELDFASAPHKLVEQHFQKPITINENTSQASGLWFVAAIATTLVVAFVLLWWAAMRLGPKRRIHKLRAAPHNTVRHTDVLANLENVSKSAGQLGNLHLTELAILATYLIELTNDFSQFEQIINDFLFREIESTSGKDGVLVVISQIESIMKRLERELRSPVSRGQRNHVEDRLEQFYRKAALSAALLNLGFVRDGLREGATLSVERYRKQTLMRLRTAVQDGDEYTMLECVELLTGQPGLALDIRAAEDKISEIHDAEDRKIREDERRTYEANIEQIRATFEAISLKGTPRESGGESPMDQARPRSLPAAVAGLAAPAAPLDSPESESGAAGALMPAHNSSEALTSHLISSQWAMEALRMQRDSQGLVERRLQELRNRRAERRELARRNARRVSDDREREVRKARLVLDSIAEQRKMRLQAEEQAQLTEEREVWAAFALERDRMTALDQRVFAMWAAVIAAVYLLVITGFDVRHGGVDGTVRWLVRAARSSCDFLSCSAKPSTAAVVVVRPPPASSATVLSSLPALPMPDAQQLQELNATAVQVVHKYQEAYRTTTQLVSDSVLQPVTVYAQQYTLTSWLVPSFLGTGGTAAGSRSAFYEIYHAVKCLLHVLMRSAPSLFCSAVMRRLGQREVGAALGYVLWALFFADILLQMALGPLLPLLVFGCLHTALYGLLCAYTSEVLRWRWRWVGGVDVRWVVVRVAYPAALGCALLSSVWKY